MAVTDVKWNTALVGGNPVPFARSESHTIPPGATGYDGFDISPVVTDWADRRTPSNPAIPLNIMLRDQSDTGGNGGYSYNEAYILAATVTVQTSYYAGAEPARAWYMTFNTPDRTPANATAMPALADIDLDGTLEAAIPMGTIDGANWADPYSGNNPNQMWVIKDLNGSGGYGTKLGWPRPARDGIRGVALADFVPTTPTDDGHLEVLATNSQDEEGNNQDPNANIFSHLYVWRDSGASVSPFAPYNLDSTYGKGYGHSYTAPVVWDVNGDGALEALFACLGQTDVTNEYELGGKIQGVDPTGPNLFQTSPVVGDPWFVNSGPNESEFQTPPVLMESGGVIGDVAAASLYGWIYAWHPNGTPVFSAVDIGLPVYNSLCTADIDGQGTSSILVSTGNPGSYWFGQPNDGAVFCLNPNGTTRWRYPASGNQPAMESGIAVGRIRGNDQPPCVVVADAQGNVYALDPVANDAGREFWTNSIPLTTHPYFSGIRAQPLIADVNGDGYQDVVVGTTDGDIYAFDGPTGGVLWHAHTFWAPDTVWDGVTEHHHEEVVGLGIGNMRADAPTNATIVVTTGQAALTTPNPVGGHVLILDCGPGTYDSAYADWPQYQQNAQRLGLYQP